ncbi:VCBS domain-containing protein [Bradyrhizobium cenepequi]|uniref:VCBS domain-containing protein n=1 Tax=Bradyrhizobium cenepequi TaxID=2821403 RepID=UPI001CE33C7E|nr:VCBS domain-containing protein [Bradyrhizobium cenepequi]MCA6110933.1 VCBS domain-containing protein [Bradyrhizobium cenepequi]
MAKSSQPKDRTRPGPSNRKAGTEPDGMLSKAIDKPIGPPDQAREEAPIGWDFGPEDQPPIIPGHDEGAPADAAPASEADDQPGAREGGEDRPEGSGGAAAVASAEGVAAAAAYVEDASGGGGQGRHPSEPALHGRGSGSLDAPAAALRPVDPGDGSRPARAAPGGGGGGSRRDDANQDQPAESYPDQPLPDTSATPPTVSPHAPPIVGGASESEVTEDTVLTSSGQLTATGAEGGAIHWSVEGGTGAYGSLTVDAAGRWTFTMNNDSPAVQGLNAGETVQEIYIVHVTDDAGAVVDRQIIVTIRGTNDLPVISGTETGEVTEDTILKGDGTLTTTDVDVGDTATWSVVGSDAGRYGELTLNPDGSWSYALDNDAAQGLKAGETVQEIFTVRATDSAGASVTQQVTVTVTGTNDVPVISGTATGAVGEDGTLTAQGALTASDADVGDTATWSLVGNDAGHYGELTLNPDGSWSYALDNDAAQGLRAGETVQEIFTVKATDSAGASVTQQVTVTVTGTNDVPVISGTATGAVGEDGTLTAQGALTSSDADIGDTATWSLVGDDTGQYGSLTLNPDGSWSYALDNDAAQGLTAGETVQEIFTVRATDSAGASVTQQVTVTVTGTNDVPVISGTATGAVAEDGTLTAQGALTTSDADVGDTATWSVVDSDAGHYGELTLNPDGSWSYALDNEAAQGLKAGETVQEIFTIKATDSAGASVTQQVTVTVTGTNDVPVISGAATGAVDEDGTLTAQGALTTSDADVGDTATWSVVGSDAGHYGELTLNSDGSWSYALDNDAAQGLKAGETVQEIFTVKATDSAGASVTQQVTVTVTGTNDVPVISGAATGAVDEDGTLTVQGALTTSDADVGDTATWSVVGNDAGHYGELTLNSDGSWSYALDNDAAQGLKAGETVQEIFTVKATDSAGASVTQQVTVTVTGTNDVPVISGTATGAVGEDGTLTAQGALTTSDADVGDTASWSVVGDSDSTYGALTLNPDGSWSYALDNEAAQGLKAGETVQEIFTVRATDSAGASVTQQVTVTITGTNDVPVISGTATGAVGEDGTLTAQGALTTSDADVGDTATWSVVGDSDSTYGALTLNPDGSWSYALDNDAAQGLKSGETVQEIFTVKATDSAGASVTQQVTVTVTGTNDVPVISGTAIGAVAEDGTLTAQGALTTSDADVGDTASWSVVGDSDSTYGALTLNPDGSWSYALDNEAAQGLKAGETVQEIFTVRATDSAGASVTQQVTVTVTGTNDVPVISGTATGAVGEDGTLTAQGALTTSDADVGDTASWSVVGDSDGTYGALTLNPDGSWSYALDNDAAQSLKAGETVQEIFTVKATDSAGASVTQQVTVTVTGTNDVPVISGTATGAVGEDGTLTAQGALTSSDADIGDTATWSLVGDDTGQYGALTLNPDGSWSYALDNDAANVQALGKGDTAQDIFTVRVTDSSGATVTQQVTITITGTDDAPLISGTGSGTVEEDGDKTAKGVLTATDDEGGRLTWQLVGDGDSQYGSLSLDSRGNDAGWHYVLDNQAAQGLREGETVQEIFTVRVTDASGTSTDYTVTVTIVGTNDVPVISGTATGAVGEDGTLTAQGALTASDVDIGDTATWSLVGDDAGHYGALTLNPDGSWSYALDNDAAQGLKAGQTAQDIFTVKATDSAGASVTQQVIVTVTGTNDVPVISGTATGAVGEDGTLTAQGALTASDADVGDTASWNVVNDGHGTYGELTVDQDGHWSYVLDNDSAQGLRDGQTGQDIFTVKVTDSSGATSEHQVTVTVTGTNDAPVISGSFTGEATEDVPTASGTLTATDPDIGDIATWSVTGNDHGTYGELTIDENGHWTYTLDDASAQGLKAGQTAQDIFTVTVTDSAGATSEHQVAVTVTGTNDAPVISGTFTGEVTEDQDLTASGRLSVTDPDIGDTATWSIVDGGQGTYGHLTLDQDGHWSYVLDNDSAQGLRDGQTAHDVFTVKVTDSDGAVAEQQITMTVTGTNDAPVISGTFTGEAQEDVTLVTSGDLVAKDVDIDDTVTWSVDGSSISDYGSFSVDPETGHWVYTLNNDAAQSLQPGQVVHDSFTVQATDESGATTTQVVTVDVTGTADAPPPPVDAGGNITLVGVEDWYNPSWGGGYHATFELTLTDDMMQGGSLEEWILQVIVNNPNAVISTGWLNGFNGTVSFDPATGTFSNVGQDYQPELHAGDKISFTIEVQGTGYNRDDISFSFQDRDLTPTATASFSASVAATAPDVDTSSDAAASVADAAAAVAAVALDHDASPSTDSTSTSGASAHDSGAPAASGDVASGPAAQADVSEVAPPVDAGGHITLVSVNDWYNPSWGGGYNATFQLTLTDDMLKGGSLEGWSLQIGVNNPNAVVSTGWLDGFNGTVSFDPATGTFSNAGQDYQPELHAGDTIQFSVQVQNAGFDRNGFSFSFQDLDPVPAAAAASAGAGAAAIVQDVGTSADAVDMQTTFMPAEIGIGEQVAHDSSHADGPASDAQPQPTTVAPEEAAAHADVAAAASDGQGAGQSQTTADAQTGRASVAEAGAADRYVSVAGGGDEHQAVAGSAAADVTTRADSDVGASADHGLHHGQGHDHEDMGLHLGQDPASHDDHGDMGLHIGQDHDALGGAAQAATSPVSADQAFATPSTAGAYLEFVQSPSSDHASMAQAADQQPTAGTADYVHMVTGADPGAHEPPSPDHLFADAQIDNSHASGAGGHDPHADAVHDDAGLAAAATPPEPMPAEQDQGHGGH